MRQAATHGYLLRQKTVAFGGFDVLPEGLDKPRRALVIGLGLFVIWHFVYTKQHFALIKPYIILDKRQLNQAKQRLSIAINHGLFAVKFPIASALHLKNNVVY